mgnify:CR=1 FL=1
MAFLPVLMSPQNGCLKQVTSNVRSFWGRYTQKCEQEAGTVAGSSGVRMVSNQPATSAQSDPLPSPLGYF